jgi:sentrin-specific protease 7
VVPKDRVLLSSVGIRIAVPAIEDESKSVTLSLNIDEIRKVLIHFGPEMPVLFFYIDPPAAARVRVALNMESKLGPYYDPASRDETQRRLILLPERLHEDSKVALKNIFGSLSNVLQELSNKAANDILVRAYPKEVQNMMKKATDVSSLKVKDEIQTILVSP